MIHASYIIKIYPSSTRISMKWVGYQFHHCIAAHSNQLVCKENMIQSDKILPNGSISEKSFIKQDFHQTSSHTVCAIYLCALTAQILNFVNGLLNIPTECQTLISSNLNHRMANDLTRENTALMTTETHPNHD